MTSPVDVILLCGGKGTRFREVTQDKVPKSLFKLNDFELIKFTTDNLDFSLVNSLIFAVDHHAESVMEWAKAQQFSCPVHFSTQTEPGVLGAVKAALSYVTTDSFIVCNTDEMRDGISMKELLKHHSTNPKSKATMLTTFSDHLSQHRVITTNSDNIVTASELKNPLYKDQETAVKQINVGFIVFKKDAVPLFDAVHGNDWSSLIHPLIDARLMGAALNPTIHYFNIGTAHELEQARSYLMNK